VYFIRHFKPGDLKSVFTTDEWQSMGALPSAVPGIDDANLYVSALESPGTRSSAMALFPNPAEHVFHIRLHHEKFDLHLFEMLGKEMLGMLDCRDQAEVTIDLPPGYYQVCTRTSKGQWHYTKLMLAR
jgi:hypothetical protein